jgi:hypothetical protein
MNPPDLVQELGRRLNLTGLTMQDGVCRLVFDRHLAVDLEDDGAGNLCLHVNLGPLPHVNREAALSALLTKHLFGVETRGAAFGLHPRTQDLYLFRTLPLSNLDVDTALSALETFVDEAEKRKGELQEIGREPRPSAAGAVPPSELIRA